MTALAVLAAHESPGGIANLRGQETDRLRAGAELASSGSGVTETDAGSPGTAPLHSPARPLDRRDDPPDSDGYAVVGSWCRRDDRHIATV